MDLFDSDNDNNETNKYSEVEREVNNSIHLNTNFQTNNPVPYLYHPYPIPIPTQMRVPQQMPIYFHPNINVTNIVNVIKPLPLPISNNISTHNINNIPSMNKYCAFSKNINMNNFHI